MKKTNLLPHEVFDLVQSTRDLKERDAIIKKHESFAIRTILQVNFSDWIKFDIPEGAPPYTPDTRPPEKAAGRINKSIRVLKDLVVGSKMPKYKKEMRFVQLLESVNEKDAEILVAMKDKKLNKLYSSLTEAFVKRNFPKIIIDKTTKTETA